MSPAQKIRMAAVQQRKQYARTPAERLLLKWVICWVLFAAVATVFMLWYLFKLAEKPVVTDHMSRLLSIHDHISTEKYRQHDRIFNAIMHNITAKIIKEQFNDMTLKDTGGRDLIRAVARYWRELGMDVVKVPTYMMLATRPNSSFDNKVYLKENGAVLFETSNRESSLIGGKAYIPTAHFTFTPAGDVTGRAVYVNFGRIEDYRELIKQKVPINNSVFLARTGLITTSEKVRNAEAMGAAGIVIFLNPNDAAPPDGGQAFPNSIWIDGNAIPRDSAAYVLGDPLTPGIPSSFGANPLSVENSAVPAVPAQPISYGDAAAIMKHFDRKPCPSGWHPSFVEDCYLMGDVGLRLQVVTHNQHVHMTTPNVIGIIRGKVEPDRFVMVGSHTSENTRGSAEPLLSVAKMVVQSKVFAALHKQKRWTPRRSIVFALFYGERPSFEGATEWVEDHLAAVQNGAVLFITSGMFSGGMFVPKAMPGLSWSLRHVANLVYSNDTITMLKEWEETNRNSTVAVAMPPRGLGDDAAFSFTAGIPTAFFHYVHPRIMDEKYPAFGTAYDSYSMVEKMDPNFHWIRMEAQASALLTRFWADRTLLPLDVLEMAEWINLRAREFDVNHRRTFSGDNEDNTPMDPILSAARQFVDSSRYFMNWTQRIRPDSPIYVRIYNDIVLRIPRVFLIPGGVPTRDVTHKNVLFSPQGYAFPGLQDLVRRHPFQMKPFGRHVAFIAECITQATEILHFLPIAQ